MKKLIVIFLLLAFGLCACANGEANISGEQPKPEHTPKELLPELEYNIEANAEAVTEKSCTFVIETDLAEDEITTGQDFYLRQYGEKLTPIVPEDQISWIAIAYIIEPGVPCRIEQNWEYIYGTLPAGTYEIVKRVNINLPNGTRDSFEVFAEFNLAYVD